MRLSFDSHLTGRQPTRQETRQAPRFRCHGPIEIRVGGWRPYPGRICNLSLTGCLLKPSRWSDCAVGDLIELRFQVNRLCFRVQCCVRWVRASGSLGVEILQVSARGRQQLRDLLKELEMPERPLR